jgi:hypothetical protein
LFNVAIRRVCITYAVCIVSIGKGWSHTGSWHSLQCLEIVQGRGFKGCLRILVCLGFRMSPCWCSCCWAMGTGYRPWAS